MFKVNQDLHYLSKVLCTETLNQGLTDLFRQQLVKRLLKLAECTGSGDVLTYRSESLINNFRMLEMVIGKEVELVKKVPDVNAT